MAKRRECGYASKVTWKNMAGEVIRTHYWTCTLPDDGQAHDRHEARDKNGALLAWWERGVDFELREEPRR